MNIEPLRYHERKVLTAFSLGSWGWGVDNRVPIAKIAFFKFFVAVIVIVVYGMCVTENR